MLLFEPCMEGWIYNMISMFYQCCNYMRNHVAIPTLYMQPTFNISKKTKNNVAFRLENGWKITLHLCCISTLNWSFIEYLNTTSPQRLMQRWINIRTTKCARRVYIYSQHHCRWRSCFLANKTLHFLAFYMKIDMYVHFWYTKKNTPKKIEKLPKVAKFWKWPKTFIEQEKSIFW